MQVTLYEIAERTGRHFTTVYRQVKDGKLPGVQSVMFPGRKRPVVFVSDPVALDRYVQEHAVTT